MSFDDIIVGAGSCGAVLAARLSEDPARRVLLLEAGPDYASLALTPADLLGPDPSLRDHDWSLRAETHAGRRIPFPRAKVVGGCSAVNGAIALRGVPADYDEWAALGNGEWGWDSVLPYFKRLESDELGESALHGGSGPIPVRRFRREEQHPTQRAAHDAYRALGFAETLDHNDPRATGVGPIPLNLRDDTPSGVTKRVIRVSTALGYLLPARNRENLEIRGGATVVRVIVERDRAVGVEVLTATGSEILRARRVTISAGAIHTPGVLVRSGIGERGDLEKLRVECVADLPGVGAKLIDHPGAGIYAVPKPGAQGASDPNHQTMVRYTATGSSEPNDMQLFLFGRIALKGTKLEKIIGEQTYLASASLVRPRSVGRLHVATLDPNVAPQVELNFCSDPEDLRRLVEGFRLSWRALHTAPLSERVASIPFWTEDVVESDALDGALRAAIGTSYHPVATAPMGSARDERAVVDQRCCVHGIENLRVVDASVMPTIPRANTNVPCMMIAERVADWMKA
jgi:choline dehydrogenase